MTPSRIGALTRHHELATSDLLERECGVIAAVAAEIGDPQVRHRGTIGGSVAHGDPASDLPAVLLALDATLTARGPAGDRTIAAADLFVDFLETSLAPDEMLTEIRVPKTGPGGFAYEKFNRRAQDWATVGAVAVRTNGATHVGLVNMGSVAAPRVGGGGGAGERCVDRRRGASTRPTAPSRPTTSTRPPRTAPTWRGCWCAAPSKPRRASRSAVSSASARQSCARLPGFSRFLHSTS